MTIPYPREIDDFLLPLAEMSDAQLQLIHDPVLALATERAGQLRLHFEQYPYSWQRPSWAYLDLHSAQALRDRLYAEIDRRGKKLVIGVFACQPPRLVPAKGA